MPRCLIIVLTVLVLWVSSAPAQELVVTFRPQESHLDRRYHYDTAVLKLALEKTVSTHGPYQLVPGRKMNFPRTIATLKANTLPHFFAKFSYEDTLFQDTDLDFVKFPVDLGIVGYRVFLTSAGLLPALKKVNTLEELKQFSMGQGAGWSDIEILRNAGFQVREVPIYESLFKMTATNRFDLLSRGTNEILDEFTTHQHIPNLAHEPTLCLAYPLPRFFITHKTNQQAIQRIESGLLLAWNDGSLKTLWQQHYKESIEFVNLANRKIFWIPNPNLDHLDFDYMQYFYLSPAPRPTPPVDSQQGTH